MIVSVLQLLFVFLTEHTNVGEYTAAIDGYQILKPDSVSKHISYHPQSPLLCTGSAISRRKYNKPCLGIITGLLTMSGLLWRHSMCTQWWDSICGLPIINCKRFIKSPTEALPALSLEWNCSFWTCFSHFSVLCSGIMAVILLLSLIHCLKTIVKKLEDLTFNLGVTLLAEYLSTPESEKKLERDETVQ